MTKCNIRSRTKNLFFGKRLSRFERTYSTVPRISTKVFEDATPCLRIFVSFK